VQEVLKPRVGTQTVPIPCHSEMDQGALSRGISFFEPVEGALVLSGVSIKTCGAKVAVGVDSERFSGCCWQGSQTLPDDPRGVCS
jgi:hypothetical protein